MFTFTFGLFTILHMVFTRDLAWGKVGIMFFLYIYDFFCLFWVIFFIRIERILFVKIL